MSGENDTKLVEFNHGDSLDMILKKTLGERYSIIIENGAFKNFVRCFHNDGLVNNLCDVLLENNDEVEIISSMSGG